MTTTRRDGSIWKLKRDRGFGFIRCADGDYFFHAQAVRGAVPFDDLLEGQRVRFTAADTGRGPRAEDVEAA